MTGAGPGAAQTGHVDAIDRTGARGWAVDRSLSGARATLAIVVNDRCVGTAVCDLPRPDLRAHGSFGDGCHGFAFSFAQPLSSDGDHRVAIAFRDTGIAVPGSPIVLHGQTAHDRLAPLLVTGAGRSGTTLLMSRLARAPAICVASGYPFETLLLSYHAGLGRVLSAHAGRDARNDVALADSDDRVAANPFFDGKWFWQGYADPTPLCEYFVGTVPHAVHTLSARLIESFYQRVATATGKSAPRFFAEKNNHLEAGPRRFARDLHGGAREIVITRDPRDLFLSQRAFFRADEERTLQGIVADCATLCEMRKDARADTLFVRYEDLLRQPRAEMARIEQFLCVSCPWEDTQEEMRQFTTHATSLSADASIGRWRAELAAPLADAIEAGCSAFLQMFDYR